MTNSDNSRQLSQKQENAIAQLILGKSDRETAKVACVTRQTVNDWRNHNAAFLAELNRRRQELWESQVQRLRQLVPQAIDALEKSLSAKDQRLSLTAAAHVLRCVGIYGTNLRPLGDTTAEEIESTWAHNKSMQSLIDGFSQR